MPERIGVYHLEGLLGTGSFATVWLGHDPVLGARVAIKVLAENWSHDLRVRERFVQEARLLRQLDDIHLVRVLGTGELPDGRPYSVMEWADGGSLRDLLRHRTPDVTTGLGLLQDIAAAVAVLHRERIVHRDLTPGNVLFRSGTTRRPGLPGRVLVADLGLAKALAAASGLTARAGTPGYMAPEQDDPLSRVDTSADVFGLGRLGVRLLCTTGADRSSPRLRAGVPPAVGSVLRRATAHEPEARYPDAEAFGDALARADHRGPWQRRLTTTALSVVAVALLGAISADTAPELIADDTATDRTGRLVVTLPAGWRAVGPGWAGSQDAGGRSDPALIMSPDPDRWPTDPLLAGAFVGLPHRDPRTTTPAAFVARRPHASCTPAPVRRTRQAGIDWVVARFSCATGKPVIVEAAGLAPGTGDLVYAQIAPEPAGGVDALLAGITVS